MEIKNLVTLGYAEKEKIAKKELEQVLDFDKKLKRRKRQ